eukprot:2126257-Rhodomonas_salina.4
MGAWQHGSIKEGSACVNGSRDGWKRGRLNLRRRTKNLPHTTPHAHLSITITPTPQTKGSAAKNGSMAPEKDRTPNKTLKTCRCERDMGACGSDLVCSHHMRSTTSRERMDRTVSSMTACTLEALTLTPTPPPRRLVLHVLLVFDALERGVVCRVSCAVCGVWSVVHCVWCIVCSEIHAAAEPHGDGCRVVCTLWSAGRQAGSQRQAKPAKRSQPSQTHITQHNTTDNDNAI